MRKILGLGLLLLTCLEFAAFSDPAAAQTPPFSGIWRGVDQGETSIQIEFSPEGFYRLSVGGKKLTENIETWGDVRFAWGKENDRYLITIFGDKEPEVVTQLEATFVENGLMQLQIFSESGTSVSSILLKKM